MLATAGPLIGSFFLLLTLGEATASHAHSASKAHASAHTRGAVAKGAAVATQRGAKVPLLRPRARADAGLDLTDADSDVVSGAPAANATAPLAPNAPPPARPDAARPAPRTPVEEALKEIESLDKQQAALRQARDAFDQALVASEVAKTEAKRLAEDVAEDIDDAESDEVRDAVAPLKAPGSRKKSTVADVVRTLLSFVVGGVLGRLLPAASTVCGAKSGKLMSCSSCTKSAAVTGACAARAVAGGRTSRGPGLLDGQLPAASGAVSL